MSGTASGLLRVSIGYLLVIWGVDKLVDPAHAGRSITSHQSEDLSMIMTRTLTYAAATILCSAAVSGAQSVAMDKKNMMDHAVTVTGCVAAGAMAGDFTLTHAMRADAKMMDQDKMAGDRSRTMPMEKDKMTGEHMMSFALKGGTELKAHVGHKVEITGTTDKPMSDMKPMTGMDDKAKKPSLTVTSVKMISATCPQ